jgi:hypothetical protein
MKTATTRPLENRRPKSFPSQLLFVLRLQIFKNKGLRNCCRKIKCFNYSAVEPRFQLRYLVFRKVTACSADGRKLKIKLYIFTFLFMKTSDESRVFLICGVMPTEIAYTISHPICIAPGQDLAGGCSFSGAAPGVPPPGAGRLNRRHSVRGRHLQVPPQVRGG